LVVDPFTGSGTTAVVAHAHGRRFTGFELSEEYAAMARERVAELDIDFNREASTTTAAACIFTAEESHAGA